jgi:PAS domain S-box-containing protein
VRGYSLTTNRKHAVITTMLFAAFSGVWIYLTDELLQRFVSTPSEMAAWSTCKGLFYLVVASLFLYFVIRALAKSQCTRCRAFFETAGDALFVHEIETGTLVDVNHTACELYGFTRGEFFGFDPPMGIPGENQITRDDFRERFFAAARGEEQRFEWKTKKRDGQTLWIDVHLKKVFIKGTQRVLGLVRDATRRKRTESSLLRLNATLRMLIKCNEALVRVEKEEELLREICRIISEYGGYPLAWVGYAESDGSKTVRPVASAGSTAAYLEHLDITWDETERGMGPTGTAIREGIPCAVNDFLNDPRCIPWLEAARRHGCRSSIAIPLIISSRVIGALTIYSAEPYAFDEDAADLMVQLAGELAYGIMSLRNREQRRRIQEGLNRTLESLAEAQAIAHLGSWDCDLDKGEEYRSDEFFRILGIPLPETNRVRDSVIEYVHPADRDLVRQKLAATLEKGKPYDVEYRVVRPDATERTVHARGKALKDFRGKITRFIGTVLDITERKLLEEKYLHAQKMEAVGHLAGGIAHDFNNILTAIIGYQHLLDERLEDAQSRHFAEQVTKLAERAASLTGDLLSFSRKETIQFKLLDLNDVIRKTGNMLKRLIGEDIELRLAQSGAPLYVRGISHRIGQVLMNLATNARDAMPNGGALTIGTEGACIDEDFVRVHGYGSPGRCALIVVSDTGFGMGEEIRKRIFEPFFTTKEAGKGTGLGLAAVYGIVQQHGGFIHVYSEAGEGTAFRIYLPLADSDTEEEEEQNSHIIPARGTETVLLVEDEPELREVIRTLLEGNGYTVLTAVDGENALEEFIIHAGEIDLLLLDVIMPKRNGKEVYDMISRIKPCIRTIFISGYTADIIERKGIPDTCHLVMKPFSPHFFLSKLRDVLDENAHLDIALNRAEENQGEKPR